MALFIHARSPPPAQAGIPVELDTGCYPEAGVCRCAPSTHSSMSRYHEVSSHGIPLFLVVTPTVMHSACKAAKHASIRQLYSTAKAPQHQISQQQSFSSGLVAGKLATFLEAVQNVAVATLQFRASRDASHQVQTYTRMWLVLPWEAVSQAQKAICKLLYLRWDGNPLQHQNTN